MEYIINPMWFYWMEVCGNAKWAVPIVAITIVGILAIITSYQSELGEIEDKDAKRRIKVIIFTLFVGIAGGLFIPSEKTLIKMQIAKFGTKDNVEVVLQTIDDKTDKLIEAIGKDDK